MSRPHSPVPQILYWSQTERLSWSLDCLSSKLGRPRTTYGFTIDAGSIRYRVLCFVVFLFEILIRRQAAKSSRFG